MLRGNRKWTWHHGVLTTILLASAFLNLYGLNREGYGNTYYAAAVKSMLMSWHNFFYAAFDPNGFISIDKPPIDFWIQAAFAKVLGFHGWVLLLPQALAGVASVAILYHLVRRTFGIPAGLIAAAVLAVTPVAVAVQRTNNVDGMLVLALLLAVWLLMKAIETKKLSWLLAMAAMEGIAFNIKMMEAYLILPAIYLTYLVATQLPWRKKMAYLLAMTATLLVVSFSWAIAVDLTPAAQRPYVGSSQTNSEMELIFGYNGISRLTGNMFHRPANRTATYAAPGNFPPNNGSRFFRPGGIRGSNFGGNRTFNPPPGFNSRGFG
ncbi:MAG: glycosyltransferase family 39 protein, partial [Firmicutes bacterium]|nr:glycosyltransferase family 39 protein [Bacillota bacterium]